MYDILTPEGNATVAVAYVAPLEILACHISASPDAPRSTCRTETLCCVVRASSRL